MTEPNGDTRRSGPAPDRDITGALSQPARFAGLCLLIVAAPLWLMLAIQKSYGSGSVFLLAAVAVYALWTFVFFCLAVYSAVKKQWRRVRNFIVVIVANLAVAALAVQSNDFVHLVLLSPYYAFVIYRNPEAAEIRFDWGATGEDGVFDFETADQRTLIFDRSGNETYHVGKVEASEGGRRYTTHLLSRFYIYHDVAILH